MDTFTSDHLHSFAAAVFQHFGLTPEDADLAADVLVTADCRGVDSHGVARLWAYVRLFERNKVNPRPQVSVLRESASTAAIDGDGGLGLIVGPRANEIAMQKAEAAGMGWVTVRNSSHYGIAGYYPLQALARNLIGWSMTNASPAVTPLWGAERNLSTNPLAVAFPAGDEPPIVIDMSTSVVPVGKVEAYRRRGQPLPAGWIVDADGHPSNRPEDYFDGGSLLPLGADRDHGGHKGYCLATLVDLLSGVLSGANWGPFVPTFVAGDESPSSVGKGVGHCFAAMRIDAFMDLEEYQQRVDHWIQTMRSTKPAPGTSGPLIPGDPERKSAVERRQTGIPLDDAVAEQLREIGEKIGIPFDRL